MDTAAHGIVWRQPVIGQVGQVGHFEPEAHTHPAEPLPVPSTLDAWSSLEPFNFSFPLHPDSGGTDTSFTSYDPPSDCDHAALCHQERPHQQSQQRQQKRQYPQQSQILTQPQLQWHSQQQQLQFANLASPSTYQEDPHAELDCSLQTGFGLVHGQADPEEHYNNNPSESEPEPEPRPSRHLKRRKHNLQSFHSLHSESAPSTSPLNHECSNGISATTEGRPTHHDRNREKNRLAASRCREKSKKHIDDLREWERELTAQRSSLAAHAAILREEVLQLKNEIIRHGDCDCDFIQNYLASAARNMG